MFHYRPRLQQVDADGNPVSSSSSSSSDSSSSDDESSSSDEIGSSSSSDGKWTDVDIAYAEAEGMTLDDLNKLSALEADEFRIEAEDWWDEVQKSLEKEDPFIANNPQSSTGESREAFAHPVYGPDVTPDPYDPSPYDGRIEEVYGRATRYTTDSAQLILNGMSSAELDALEREIYSSGYWDEKDQEALNTRNSFGGRGSLIGVFGQIIIAADQNRVSWQQQMEGDRNAYEAWLEGRPEEEKEKTWAQRNPFQAPHFLKPDYATLAQRTKYEMRNELRREPTASEMKLLTEHLASGKRDEWQANTYDTALADWQTRARAYETETDQTKAPVVQGVDAEARFSEMFEQRYEGELDHRKRVASVGRKSNNLFGSIDTISRMTS